VGLEFGQMFRRFGSRVTIVQHADQLLGREDEDVADAVAEILEEDGVAVRLSTEATRAEKQADGGVRLTVEQNGQTHPLDGSHLLVATGRRPNTDDLNLDAADVETGESGHVQVNDRLETSAEGIYAIGDVKGGPAFTHISYDDYLILHDNFLHGKRRTTQGRLVPYTVFIDPQLGRVGLTEKQADEESRSYEVAKLPMEHVARAIETDETRGFMKALVDPDTKQILGVSILGKEGGEVMSILQVAIMGELPYTALRDGAFAHPTLAESLNNLFSTLDE
jgi:pyruvate/2-oxoglutarate dehydrogenase complex dihydrolipoamide dehydrogenase (E3) component